MFKNYRGFWFVLVAAFVFFAAISAMETPPTIGDYELASSKIWPTLAKDRSVKTESELAMEKGKVVVAPGKSPSGQGKVNKVKKSEPIDTVPKTILFFGDSMLDGLYPRLAAYAKENGHTLYAVIWYSSTSEVWGKSDKLKKYIADLKPDYIFVSLGANELFVKDIAEKRDKYVKKIVSDIGDIPYVWIGPPNWKEDTGINDLIAGNIGPEHFFVSKDMKFKRMKDGAHPTHDEAIRWMDSVVQWMPAHSAHPIKLNLPSEKKSRAKRVFVHQPNEK